MNHELRALVLMLGAVRLELRAQTIIGSERQVKIKEIWEDADLLARGARELLEDASKVLDAQ